MAEPTRTVSRAINVLLCFSHSEPELTLTEISTRLGIHKSTLHRLLGTLEAEGFVRRDPVSGKYRLGTRLLELADLVVEHSDLQRRALPYLYRLAGQYLETVDLSVLDGSDVVYLEVVESPQRVKLAARPGQRLPAHSTASGKALLAYLPTSQKESSLPPELRRFTGTTLSGRQALEEDLERTCERGFAMSLQEYEEGINAVAAPVLDVRGYPISAIAVAGPSFRLTLERMLEVGPTVRTTADALGEEVGSLHAPGAVHNGG
jgi:IclR family KDG regulon transcriptional repressor